MGGEVGKMTNHLFDGLLSHKQSDALLARMPDGRTFTYGTALEVSARFANVLVACGVKAGDRVAVQVPKSIEAVMLYLACVRVGAVFLPLNTAYTADEVEYVLSDAEPSLFICDPNKRDAFDQLVKARNIAIETLGVLTTDGKSAGSFSDKAMEAGATFQNAECGADSLAAILYTSGTTGRSKGAMMSHDNLLSNAKSLVELWQFSSNDVLLHALPIFHTHGLFVAINVTLLAGSSMLFLPAFNNDEVIEQLPDATAMMGVPTFYTRLLDDNRFTKELVDHMRVFISGSAPLLAETHQAFERLTGQRILERYGMTETNMITSNPYDGERKAGTVGFALPRVEMKVCDAESGKQIADGEIGSIELRGPNVFSGYWRMPEKTAEEFREDGFFITGDLGVIDEDGYLKIVGRNKDLIISGGYNIYPKEIELLLDEQEGVLESAVIGVPHPDFGEGVFGLLVAKEGALDCDAILRAISSKIARFKQPKKLVVVDELPRNTMGKVQKNILRERYKNAFSAPSP